MKDLKSMRELEMGYTHILNHFFYDITTPVDLPKNLRTEMTTSVDRVRHNFQAYQRQAEAKMNIYYMNKKIAECERLPKPLIVLNRHQPDKAPKGYLATKVLERVLWYKFPNVRVE